MVGYQPPAHLLFAAADYPVVCELLIWCDSFNYSDLRMRIPRKVLVRPLDMPPPKHRKNNPKITLFFSGQEFFLLSRVRTFWRHTDRPNIHTVTYSPAQNHRRCRESRQYGAQIPCPHCCVHWCNKPRRPFFRSIQPLIYPSRYALLNPVQYFSGSICPDLSGMDKILSIQGL